MGLPLEAMILGTIAGAVVHGLNRCVTQPNGIATIITSAFGWCIQPGHIGMGGFATGNRRHARYRNNVGKPLVPVLIGAAWPWFLPMLNDGIQNLWAGWINKLGGRHE